MFNDALTHFIYGYMASHIWKRSTQIAREETHCRHLGYSFRLAAMVLLYASSHRQDTTYHSLCYTSRGVLAGTRNRERWRARERERERRWEEMVFRDSIPSVFPS